MERIAMTNFNVYTPSNAPEKSKGLLKGWLEKLGFVPNVIGVMAESPALLKGYGELSGAFDGGILSPVERMVVKLSISSLNDCGYCVAAHSTVALKAGMPKDVLESLRAEKPIKDGKLEALRLFTVSLAKKLGHVDKHDLELFYKAGYTKAYVLEVVLGWSVANLGNYVNHIAQPELDKGFEGQRFVGGGKHGGEKVGGKSHVA
jgi:AhpD family alkylhydroperoxidase